MGNKENTPTYHHPSLGEVRKISSKYNNVLQADFEMVDEIQAKKFMEGLEIAKSFKNPYLYLPTSASVKKGFGCTDSAKLQLQFQQYLNNLGNDIMERNIKGNHYNKEDLWRTIYILSKSAKDFQQRGLKMGNIHPESVLINGDLLNQIKLVNRYSWPQPIGIEKVLESNQGSYICILQQAPRQLQQLNKKRIYEVEAKERGTNDTFAIGMTALEMGTLLSSQNIYNFGNCKIDHALLQRRLKDLYQIYQDQALYNTVRSMLDLEDKRLPVADIWAFLAPYENQIFGGRPFKLQKQKSRESVDRYHTLHP